MKLIEIMDLEFIIRPFHDEGAVISGQSKSLNISCHVRLMDDLLKSGGLKYLEELCTGIKQSLAYQYQNGLIGQKNNE